MSRDNGRNPMRWNCETQGCFNIKKRPKIELFAECLPGKIAMTDVDGLTEVCGNLLYIEWKDHPGLSLGQRILFERMTALCPATVIIVEGDAEEMTVSSICIVWNGTIGSREEADLEDLKNTIRAWSDWAIANSAVRQLQEASCN